MKERKKYTCIRTLLEISYSYTHNQSFIIELPWIPHRFGKGNLFDTSAKCLLCDISICLGYSCRYVNFCGNKGLYREMEKFSFWINFTIEFLIDHKWRAFVESVSVRMGNYISKPIYLITATHWTYQFFFVLENNSYISEKFNSTDCLSESFIYAYYRHGFGSITGKQRKRQI